MEISVQIVTLFVMALAIACVAWTVTHEEIFREPREYCVDKSKTSRSIYQRKFFYLFTCEYCFSHYVTLIFVVMTGFKLLYDDWRGYIIGFFALVWIANVYMTIFGYLRQSLKVERLEGNLKDNRWHEVKEEKELTENK